MYVDRTKRTLPQHNFFIYQGSLVLFCFSKQTTRMMMRKYRNQINVEDVRPYIYVNRLRISMLIDDGPSSETIVW